jgi:hypothetical protein
MLTTLCSDLFGDGSVEMMVSDRELALRTIDIEFQREVLDKLVRLETKMDALVGNTQPGRMKIVEDKVAMLERSDLRNSLHNRLVNERSVPRSA